MLPKQSQQQVCCRSSCGFAGDAEAGTQGISFDDALTKYVGEFGKGQVSKQQHHQQQYKSQQ
jgi:hypothetical protein